MSVAFGQRMARSPHDLAPHQRTFLADEALRGIVLGYLVEYPDGMDTIEGIAEWWITRQQIRVDVERLATVLDQLVRAGVLETVTDGGRCMYRLAGADGGAAPAEPSDGGVDGTRDGLA